jgi:hypothetical protein
VPGWIATCLETVRGWAERSGLDYCFIDDALFDHAPAWARERFGRHLFALSDLARLHLLKDGLRRGYRRVAWIDADVLVFDRDRFDLDMVGDFAFCREHMLTGQRDGSLRQLAAVMPLGLFTQIGLFTPLLLGELAVGATRLARLYAAQAATPLAAGHLCHFVRHGAMAAERLRLDSLSEAAIDILLATRGEVINRHLPRGAAQPVRRTRVGRAP